MSSRGPFPPTPGPTTVPLQGTFQVTISPQGAPASVPGFASFTVDGAMFDAPPGLSLKNGLGSWIPNPNGNGYLIRFMRFIANPVTNFRGKADIQGTMFLSADGNSFTGEFRDVTFDANGNQIVQGRGTVTGQRYFPPVSFPPLGPRG